MSRGPLPAGPLVEAASEAVERAGVRAGDRLQSVDGRPVVDALDVEFAAADGGFTLVIDRGGRRVAFEVRLRPGEGHGLVLAGGLGGPTRVCRNTCRFCFVDQLPAGLRPGLYVKDDDYRLSFLEGNFVTLSNMDEDDLERVERLRLSPLYVSLHAWDDEPRVALMGPATADSRVKVCRLAAAGIRLHVQVVLCPGWNDGAVLEETVLRLAELTSVDDVGVVPVSLAREHGLRRVTPHDAAAVIGLVGDLQARVRVRRGTSFVHAADEFYLLTGSLPPASDAELQYENGIGIAAAFLEEAAAAAESRSSDDPPLALLTGTLALPVVSEVCVLLPGARPFAVENRLFGAHVTVTGLLGGREVATALEATPLAPGEWLVAPRAFLPAHVGATLDGMRLGELSEAAGGRLAVAASLSDALRLAAAAG